MLAMWMRFTTQEAPCYTVEIRRDDMLKAVGAIMVILSSTAIGFYFSSLLRARIQELSDLRKTLFILRGDIQYGNTPLPEALQSIALRNKSEFKPFYMQVSEKLCRLEGESFQEIWSNGVDQCLNETALTKEDKLELKRLGENLGHLDREMQVRTIDLYLEIIKREMEEATTTIKEKTKLYNTLGILAGLFITIVMI